MLNVVVTEDINKLNKQIEALKYELQHDTRKKDISIHQEALKRLNEELLCREYLKLQSKEFNSDVIGYERLVMVDKDIAIKVIFKNMWLHVYRTQSGQIEWY